jgi:hypothetical protein
MMVLVFSRCQVRSDRRARLRSYGPAMRSIRLVRSRRRATSCARSWAAAPDADPALRKAREWLDMQTASHRNPPETATGDCM